MLLQISFRARVRHLKIAQSLFGGLQTRWIKRFSRDW